MKITESHIDYIRRKAYNDVFDRIIEALWSDCYYDISLELTPGNCYNYIVFNLQGCHARIDVKCDDFDGVQEWGPVTMKMVDHPEMEPSVWETVDEFCHHFGR